MITKVFSSNRARYFYYITIAVAFFLVANSTFINGGDCIFSACYAEEFRNDGAIYDLFITSYNTTPVAPSTLLFPVLVEDNPSYQFMSYNHKYTFDYNDNEIYGDSRDLKALEILTLPSHERNLVRWFWIIKAIVLLSLPLWLLCAFILRLIAAAIFKSHAQPALLVFAVFTLLLSIQFHILLRIVQENYPSVTWPILLHQDCCQLRSPG